jgi:hypothetical protein
MNEIIDDLVKEMQESLKRAEHSVFVSLKYTRTVDVIKNLVDRYITTLSYCVDALIEYLFEKRIIQEKPENLIDKTNIIYEQFPRDELLADCLDFLIFLRKASRAEYGKCEEFRRHVTMSVKIDGADYEIDIDVLMEAFQSMKKYVEHTRRIMKEIKNED